MGSAPQLNFPGDQRRSACPSPLGLNEPRQPGTPELLTFPNLMTTGPVALSKVVMDTRQATVSLAVEGTSCFREDCLYTCKVFRV